MGVMRFGGQAVYAAADHRLERGGNAELATIARYIHAAGGRLEISAILHGKCLMLLSEMDKSALYERKYGPRLTTKLDRRRRGVPVTS